MRASIRPVLVVVDVSDAGRDDPVFDDVLRGLTARVVAAGESVGFAVRRVVAEQLGTEGLLAAVAGADAVVLTGGEDVAPTHYGGPASYPHQGQHFTTADAAQIALVHRVVEDAVPTLGICRGMQVVNVALGGDLVQHLDGGAHVRPGDPRESMVDHRVVVAPDSRLAAALADTAVEVRSSHHQAVGRLGVDLVVTASAPDGTVEAVEHVTAPLWAVQWHPEDVGADGSALRDLLAAMVPARVAQRDAAPDQPAGALAGAVGAAESDVDESSAARTASITGSASPGSPNIVDRTFTQ